jgi:hypothetical protein
MIFKNIKTWKENAQFSCFVEYARNFTIVAPIPMENSIVGASCPYIHAGKTIQ